MKIGKLLVQISHLAFFISYEGRYLHVYWPWVRSWMYPRYSMRYGKWEQINGGDKLI